MAARKVILNIMFSDTPFQAINCKSTTHNEGKEMTCFQLVHQQKDPDFSASSSASEPSESYFISFIICL